MKTEQQVRDKLKEHEDSINEILKEGVHCGFSEFRLERLQQGRKAMQWVLSDKPIERDDLDKKISFELTVFESSKIF